MNKKPLILVVDDDSKNLQMIGKMLQSIELDLSFATSAQKALSLLETITPDLIILDIIMPGMNGLELCEQIFRIQRFADVPVIFLSAKTSIEDIVRGFKTGARDYLTKPIIKEELLARVSAQLSIKLNNDRLKALNSNLEEMVSQRTKELEEKNIKLSEYNTALTVILEKRNQDKKNFENNVLSNVIDQILPIITRLKQTDLDKNQLNLAILLEKNLKSIVSPFARDLKTALSSYGLTSLEYQIAHLIKDGHSSSQIAETLNRSESTIAFHRNNIRKKLKIKNKQVNLNTFLNTLDGGPAR